MKNSLTFKDSKLNEVLFCDTNKYDFVPWLVIKPTN